MGMFSAAALKGKVQDKRGVAPTKSNVFGTKTEDEEAVTKASDNGTTSEETPTETEVEVYPTTEEGSTETTSEPVETKEEQNQEEPKTLVMPDLGENVPQPPPPLYAETMASENYLKEKEEDELTTEPSLGDSGIFQRLAQNTQPSDGGVDTYSELVESMVSQQCQLSGVKNLDLTTFGLRAQVLSFPNLSVMTYGIHKFLGAPFTEEEENMIIHRLGLHVAQSDKSKVVVRAVKEIKDSRGMSFFSLLFNDKIAQRFANVFNYTVHANTNEADVSKLVLVIQK